MYHKVPKKWNQKFKMDKNGHLLIISVMAVQYFVLGSDEKDVSISYLRRVVS